MIRKNLLRASAMLVGVLVLAGGTAMSCPVCFGAADSPSTQGVTAGIISLLGVTGGVLTGFGSLFLRMRSRSHREIRQGDDRHHE
jgi:hypothetical protein